MTSETSSISVVNEWIKTPDGHDIFTKTWKPVTTPVAHLVMIHGFGEHIGRYDEMFTFFAENGILCYGYDQRGFGQTAQKSHQFGNNQGYDTALADINDAVKRTKQADIPLFLMGHSMGGGLILNYLSRPEKYDGVKSVTGAIASAPLVTLSMPISPFRYYPLLIASKLVPSFVIQVGIDPKSISHDENEIEEYKRDPLIHDYATLGTVRGFLDAGKDMLEGSKNIHTPILYSHGIPDPVNSYNGTATAYENTSSQDKTLKAWEGLFHELHHEKMPEKRQVIETYLEWIKARISSNA